MCVCACVCLHVCMCDMYIYNAANTIIMYDLCNNEMNCTLQLYIMSLAKSSTLVYCDQGPSTITSMHTINKGYALFQNEHAMIIPSKVLFGAVHILK